MLVFEGILTVDHLPTSASPLNRICWSAQPTNNFMRAKVSFSSFEVRPGGSVGCWPSSAPVCRPSFWSIKSTRLILIHGIHIVGRYVYQHPTGKFIHTLDPVNLYYCTNHSFVIYRSTRESYEGAQSARPPTFRAGGPALFICYLLYAINTLGYSPFCFRVTSQILLLF